MNGANDEKERLRRRAAILAVILALSLVLAGGRRPPKADGASPAPSGAFAAEEVPAASLRPEPSPPRPVLVASEPAIGPGEQALRDAVRDVPLFLPDSPAGDPPPYHRRTISLRPPRDQWSGAHIGVIVGGVVGNSALRSNVDAGVPGVYFLAPDIAQIDGLGSSRATPLGFTGGVEAGYDHQAGSLVYGLEADFSSFNLKDSRTVTSRYDSSPGTAFTLGQSFRTDWLITIRPRVGWATERFLFYGTGGVAATRLKYVEQFTDTFNPAFETDSFSKTRVGWTVGAGAEYLLNERWRLKGEYLFTDFGSMTNTSYLANPPGHGDQFVHSASLTAHLLRVGLDWRF